jgi:hypothetical protein
VGGRSAVTAVIYPLDLHRKFGQRKFQQNLASRSESPLRQSPPEGTDSCVCGHSVIAPASSTCTSDVVINHWHCDKCGREWTTSALDKS